MENHPSNGARSRPGTSAARGHGRAGPGATRPGPLARISGWCFDHGVAAVGLWIAGLAAIFSIVGALGPTFDGAFDIPDSESADGFAVLDEHFADLGAGGQSGTIVFRASQGVDDPEVTAAMEELFSLVDAGFPDDDGDPSHPGATVISPYSEQGQGQIAREGPLAGELAYAQVNLAADVDFTESSRLGGAIAEHAPDLEGLDVHPGGVALAESEPPSSELIGLAFAVVILIAAFGSVLAMGLPIAVALCGVGAGVGLTMLLSAVYAVPDFTPTVGVMIGLGVGIDYALFVVTRFRQGLHEGRSARDATIVAMSTAGRAVIFAGITVVISLLGMLIIGIRMVSGMGIGASVTVAMTMVSSLTLLPALLGLARDRVEVTRWRGLVAAALVAVALLGAGINVLPLAAAGAVLAFVTLLVSIAVRPLRGEVPRRAVRPTRETSAYRWSRTIQRNPWRWVGVGGVGLVLLAAPVAVLRLGVADEGNHPEGSSTRQAYDLLAEGFGAGFNGPFLLAVTPEVPDADPGEVAASVAGLRDALAATPGVAAVSTPMPDDPASPGAYLMTLIPTTEPQAEATDELVSDLRTDVIPSTVADAGLDVAVTGLAAANIDLTEFLARRVPVFFAAVLALSFVLLMVVFRSLLVPLKAVVMNVASIAATYGVIVAVFQWGWGGGLLGISGAPIEPFMPMMLFAVVFGLSMDYEVFLLSRVREEYLRTGDSVESVADGLAATAKVITAAAAIMIVLFGSFVFEDDRLIKMLGLGLATAVLLDVTLVRMLLVPATMELLGDRNWWMPRWLDRMLPQLDVDGGHAGTPIAAPATALATDDAPTASAGAGAGNGREPAGSPTA